MVSTRDWLPAHGAAGLAALVVYRVVAAIPAVAIVSLRQGGVGCGERGKQELEEEGEEAASRIRTAEDFFYETPS